MADGEQLSVGAPVKGSLLLMMASADAANLDMTGHAGLTLGVLQTMNPADVIKAYGLTG